MSNNKTIRYKPLKTLKEFHESNAKVRLVTGCYGSGKSVGMCMEIFKKACQVPCSLGSNVRRSRTLVVRHTYPELTQTTLKTFREWFPPSIMTIKGLSPIEGRINIRIDDGTIVDLHILFMAVDDTRLDSVKSLEITNMFINEGSEISKDVFEACQARCGRFPAKKDLPEGTNMRPFIYQIMDTNTGITSRHWIYQLFEANKPKNWAVFHQPPALLYDPITQEYSDNPEAENIENHSLGYDYYRDMLDGKSRDWIRVYVQGEYALLTSGKPVFEEFDMRSHVSGVELDVIPSLEMGCGLDFGLNPSAVFGQITPSGTLNIIAELTTENMGFEEFCEALLIPFIHNNYRNIPMHYFADVAGQQHNQATFNSPEEIGAKFGITMNFPSVANRLQPRLDAVRHFLIRRNGFSVSRNCPIIISGLHGEYHYEKLGNKSIEAMFKLTPSKNFVSHLCDALQYLCLGLKVVGKREELPDFKVKPQAPWSAY